MMLDLQLRAIEQPISRSRRALKVPGIGDDSGAHFSREYMSQLVQEVQQALAAAGMDGPARQAQGLLLSRPGPGSAQQAVPEGLSAGTSSSVDILASELPTAPGVCVRACACVIASGQSLLQLKSQATKQAINQSVHQSICQSISQYLSRALQGGGEPEVIHWTKSVCLRLENCVTCHQCVLPMHKILKYFQP